MEWFSGRNIVYLEVGEPPDAGPPRHTLKVTWKAATSDSEATVQAKEYLTYLFGA